MFNSTNQTIGNNVEIKKYRNKIQKMRAKIDKLERKVDKNEIDMSLIHSYKNVLRMLLHVNGYMYG